MKKLSLALCEGRHSIPDAIDGAIFPNTIDPLDLGGMAQTVRERLHDADSVDLYVTGLTVALGEVIRYCATMAIPLTLWHYNRDTDNYYPQPLLIRDAVAAYDYDYTCITGASRNG